MNMMSTINPNKIWNFPVEMMPTPNAVTGEPEPDAFQVVRTDTNTVLGHHGSRYKLVPHDDVVNSIMDAVKESKITTDYNEPTISVFENGRKMRGEIIFPDLTIETQIGDYTKAKTELGWSPETSFEDLVKLMVESDLKLAEREKTLIENNLLVPTWEHSL